MIVQLQKPVGVVYILLTTLFILAAFLQTSFAVNPCITPEKETQLRHQFPKQYGNSIATFEQWMSEKIAIRKQQTAHQKQGEETRIIPIIFHIVNGCEPIGTGTNVAAELIQAQLNQLNADFRQQNADFDGSWSQAADTDIEFCLATVDQHGNCLPEAGIMRWDTWGEGPHDDDFIDVTIKPNSIQDPSSFLNFWVIALQPGFLGYAQFPDGDPIGDGSLTYGSHAATTDGVVCTHTAIGSLDYPNPIDPTRIGRTATHEVGHWLGLRHIWGDGGCGVDDYCSDTPSAEFANVNCTPISHCGSQDMIQNYMDYTSDACRNLFTIDQKARMDAVLNFSTNRPFNLNSIPTVCQPLTTPSANFIIGNSSSSICNTSSLLSNDFSAAHLCLENNNTITITDKSTCNAGIWNWTFEGGTPSTYTGQTPPSIAYNSVGTYAVTLQVCNLNGTNCDTYTIDEAVHVYSGANCNNSCGEIFTDNGGENGNYTNNTTTTWTFCPAYPSTQVSSVAFSNFDVESNAGCSWDYLKVFDGETITAPAIGQYCGTELPNDGVITATNPSGCLTFQFVSDASTSRNGWEAVVNCIARASCGDGIQNGDETGVDCGGANCPACPTCGTSFTDDGGINNNYNNDELATYILCPDEPSCQGLSITFTDFDLESSAGSGANGTGCWDYLQVFDGPSDASTPLGVFCGNTLADAPGGGSPLTSTHNSGCLTFVFTSDGSNTGRGWSADIACTNTCPCTSDNDCDDGDDCTIDTCDPVNGCIYTTDPSCNCTLTTQTDEVDNSSYYTTIEINILNGQAPYTYDWTTNNFARYAVITPEKLRVLCTESSYWAVTITDANGCSTIATTQSDEDFQNMLNISQVSIFPDDCQTDDLEGAINIVVTGGASGNYTYDWLGPINAPTLNGNQLSGLPSGWYLVEVCDTDGDGVCDDDDEKIMDWYWVPCDLAGRGSKVNTSSKKTALSVYPNPFQQSTNITFTATYTGLAKIQLLDATGHIVESLFESKAIAGQNYSITFEAAERLTAGVYIAQFIQADGSMNHQRLLLVR